MFTKLALTFVAAAVVESFAPLSTSHRAVTNLYSFDGEEGEGTRISYPAIENELERIRNNWQEEIKELEGEITAREQKTLAAVKNLFQQKINEITGGEEKVANSVKAAEDIIKSLTEGARTATQETAVAEVTGSVKAAGEFSVFSSMCYD